MSPRRSVLMGLPGVGKTHCARLLAERLGAAHVASDQLRSQLFVAASYADPENLAVFRILDALVGRLLEDGHRVIVDATHLAAARGRAPPCWRSAMEQRALTCWSLRRRLTR